MYGQIAVRTLLVQSMHGWAESSKTSCTHNTIHTYGHKQTTNKIPIQQVHSIHLYMGSSSQLNTFVIKIQISSYTDFLTILIIISTEK